MSDHDLGRGSPQVGKNGCMGERHGRATIRSVLCAERPSPFAGTGPTHAVGEIMSRHDGVALRSLDDPEVVVFTFALASNAVCAALELRATTGTSVAVDVCEWPADGSTSRDGLERCHELLRAANERQVVTTATALDLARPGIGQLAEVTDLGVHHIGEGSTGVWIWQLDPDGATTHFPPLRTRDTLASSLPTTGTSFVGRASDVASLAALIAEHRVVSIVGAGGCGKTRIAVEVAFATFRRFRDGVAWVDLAPLTDPTTLPHAVAAAVGLSSAAEITLERITEHLGQRALLVVLDNCEHVATDAARAVAAITSSCPAVRLLTTSREPLALANEVVWRIPSLAVPEATDGTDLLGTDAGRLLVERIRLVRPHFEPDASDTRSLATVCRRLGGIPLALELAAARTSTMSPSELAGRLDERFGLLLGGARDSVARQRTLEASIAWSYRILTEDEQRCFRVLSVFPGPFTLDAALAVCGDGRADAERSIGRLRAASLLVDRAGRPHERLQMLEPIRWFARERLIDCHEADAALGRHLDWACSTARVLGDQLEGAGVSGALEQLDAEIDNLRAAMDWAVDHDRAADAATILASTSWYWVWRGRVNEMEQWLASSGLDTAQLEPCDRLDLVWAIAELTASRAGGIAELVEEGTALARDLGNRGAEAKFRVSHSRVLAFTDPHGTLERAPAEREMCRHERIPFWSATSLVSEALAHITLGRFDRAEPLLDQLRIEARALRHPQLIADDIARRALVDRRFGRYDAVRRAVGEIDTITAGFTTLNSQALVHAQAALVDVAQGRAEQALIDIDLLYRHYRVAGELGYLPSIALPIIDALIDLGRPSEALERFDPLWQGFRRTISWRLRLGSVRATAMLAAGDIDGARVAFTAVVDEARTTPNEHEAAIAERFLAAIDRTEQRFADAEARLHRALEVQSALGYPQYVADVLEELAGIELEHDRPHPAAVLFGAAAAIREQSGVMRRIGRQDAYDADIADLEHRLGTELSAHWQRGAALTMSDAVELAQRGRGERGRPATGWESLTATERKVAELVAAGRTNPEIAEALIVGRATVKTHVSSILRKLGLANRTQLAGLAARKTR
jgi:predicted ATPase/DNA-binding CsgD family transcriptional regulator